MKPLLLLVSGMLCLALLSSVSSCRKDTTCKARVKCIDSANTLQSGAYVELFAAVKSPDGKTTTIADVKANGQTGGDGTVEFIFKLPAIYDIKATKVIGTQTLTGVGIIKLEEGETVEKTVIMK